MIMGTPIAPLRKTVSRLPTVISKIGPELVRMAALLWAGLMRISQKMTNNVKNRTIR
jgi:hypothetical protein